jgi:DNA replication protein DnaC
MSTNDKTPEVAAPRFCGGCGDEFNATPDQESRCPACAEKARELEKAKREAEWKTIVPPTYLATDLARLPSRLRDLAENWTPVDGRGLLLSGESGRGKTRCLWAILARLHNRGARVAAMAACDLGEATVDKFSDDDAARKQARRLWSAARSADVLLLDDCDKVEFSKRFSSDLFALLEHRVAWRKPVLTSTNLRSQELEEAMGRRGAPILRRIKEFCTCVTV